MISVFGTDNTTFLSPPSKSQLSILFKEASAQYSLSAGMIVETYVKFIGIISNILDTFKLAQA